MDKIVPNVPLTYLEIPYKSTWQVNINAFRVGEKPTFSNGAKSAFYFKDVPAYLDTFSPFIKLPASSGTEMFAKFFHEVTDLKQEDGLLMGPCNLDSYQSINLFINDQFYVKMQPESFVIDIGVRGKCFIPFTFSDDESFTLGEPFFRNFYSVFDDSKGIVGIAPSVNFVHSTIVQGIVPNDELPQPGQVAKERNRQNMQKVPDGSDPIAMIKYYIGKAQSFIFGQSNNSAPGGGSGSTLEIVGIVVVVGLLVACCCAAGIYGLI